MNEPLDCVVIGGGSAGLSAALVLGRARRRTLLVDAGGQSNLPDPGVGGLLGHEGRPPAELYEAGRRDLEGLPSVEVRSGTVRDGAGEDQAFTLELDDGTSVTSRKVLLAMGMDYVTADLPGLTDLWGDSVFHCPFCHGWDVRDKAVAVRSNGAAALHGALMIRGWTDNVVLLTDGPADFGDGDRGKFEAAGIVIDERPLAGLKSRDGSLSAIEFTEGDDLERDAMLVAAQLHQRSDLPARLGAKNAEPTLMAKDALAVDQFKRTSVSGIFAAGDLAGDPAQVSIAAASGHAAALAVIQNLLAEDFGLPLPPAMTSD
ncbi:MAG: NAD(P)/FAD-dependent oxidoreductase [Solirubrobacterales bacterium]